MTSAKLTTAGAKNLLTQSIITIEHVELKTWPTLITSLQHSFEQWRDKTGYNSDRNRGVDEADGCPTIEHGTKWKMTAEHADPKFFGVAVWPPLNLEGDDH